jgi:D,D-heptose 1,7-bisphosphate phosphatase
MKDVGTPQRLSEVNGDWASGKITRMNRRRKRPAVFLDRDGVINKEVDLLHRIADFELLPGVAEAIRSINLTEYLTVVVTNQPVIARNLCSIDELHNIHNKMETLLGRERAKLDGIYYCPHHPDSGYPEENPDYKIACRCRKPDIGLIEQAAADFNIDLNRSFFIGDSERDIRCGENAGLTTIGLKTGKGCKNSSAKPDYMFDDLPEAARFIIYLNNKI